MLHWDKIIGGASAVVSIAGAVWIWVDAQKMNNKFAEILLELVSKVGLWVDHPWLEEKKDEFRNIIKESSLVNKRGFILLIIGFCLQLLSFFF